MRLSALILAKNEEEMIEGCLEQLDFVDEIIILDQGSMDRTVQIAKKYTDKIFKSAHDDFGKNRTILAQHAKGDWLLYLDCDERITKKNVEEINSAIKGGPKNSYYFPRKNFILGKEVKHGGWWPDYVPRLFYKSNLKGWYGRVHESPKIEGAISYMKNPIIHFTAREVNLMFLKSIKWAKTEAELRYEAHQPKVNILKTIKAMGIEFLNRYFVKRAFLDGSIGLIESIYQGLHQAMVMAYLWELQNKTVKTFKG
jgi:glycosyltransferase involved in cell wall biosynthesis